MAPLAAVGVLVGMLVAVVPSAGVSIGSSPVGQPTSVTATASDGQALVHWVAPAGKVPIDQYVVSSEPPGLVATVPGTTRSAYVDGLTNGDPYAFVVTARGPDGTGEVSWPSNVVRSVALIGMTSSVQLRSVNALFNGGACLDGGVECFGIQQNFFVRSSVNARYWVQNIVFLEEGPSGGWEAEGAYEIWNGTQQLLLSCSGQLVEGTIGPVCDWWDNWRPVRLPASIGLSSLLVGGEVIVGNSVGGRMASWVPNEETLTSIVSPQAFGTYSQVVAAPELVLVGEMGRHDANFDEGAGTFASKLVLGNGQVVQPGTTCVTKNGATSTGEESIGFYWNVQGNRVVDFAAHGGSEGDGDGVTVLPSVQAC
jgi:fibronectin type III domain protein